MASDDVDAAAARSACEERGSVFAGCFFVGRDVVPLWGVAKYKQLCLKKLDPSRFGVMFSDRRNSTMFGRHGVRRDTNIGAWIQRWPNLGSWCVGLMAPAGRFGMTFIRHADEVTYVRSSRLMPSAIDGDWDAMGGYDLIC